MSKSEGMASDVAATLRVRTAIVWIRSPEEARVERYLYKAGTIAGYTVRIWDIAAGVTDITGKTKLFDGLEAEATPEAMPEATLTEIARQANTGRARGLWIMRDLPVWLAGPLGARTLRQLRNLARLLPGTPNERAQAIIILTTSTDIPPELADHVAVFDWPLPDRAELADAFDNAIRSLSLPDDQKIAAARDRDAAIDAAVGLSEEEAQATFCRSLVRLRRIDAAVVAKEKRRIITRERALEWFDPIVGGLDAIGGLDNLKTWPRSRSLAYSPQARAYGLPAPRGALLVGISGGGKSLTAKAIASTWGVPLLRIDLGALKSKFVGESEANLRRAFKVIEAIGRCVVWLDEIEKALQGATSGSADGGVSADALGAVLTWMQERQGEAFVVATANEVQSLPPELMRAGRFDCIWFIDLPTPRERAAILEAALRTHGRDPSSIDAGKIAAACEGFTGSEIAALVPDALFTAFADGARPITTDDLLTAAATVTPLSKTAAEKISRLREWARGRARPANSNIAELGEQKRVRALDL